ncbi:unnamed protein product [Schistocephalus solidus]|uniref:Endo/exonuclease/phosphatase domain-containing protein n=1 Tax=Schistocephalus solidus TaxID=70667 RepID=A0A183SX27_SCHSO|nr:unnamed protein product [Schistocephalus solidus]
MQALAERLPRRDLLIVAGDWNGQTGRGDSTNSHLIGHFRLGSRCGNGARLLNFADQSRLFVINTGFQHRNKHLLTWYSNNGHTASHIDYILVSSQIRSWVHGSGSMCGAETGNAYGSDHVLITVQAGQLSDAEVGTAAGDLVYVYYVHYPAPQTGGP